MTDFRHTDTGIQARGDALALAASSIGSHVGEDALIRAANWILTNDHPTLTTDASTDTQVADGGDPSSFATAAAEHQERRGLVPPGSALLYGKDRITTARDVSAQATHGTPYDERVVRGPFIPTDPTAYSTDTRPAPNPEDR